MPGYLIGLDYGTEFARGILLDSRSGTIEGSHTHVYRHGVMTATLPDGTPLPPAWALQVAPDYTEAAAKILGALGCDKQIDGIGLGFTPVRRSRRAPTAPPFRSSIRANRTPM